MDFKNFLLMFHEAGLIVVFLILLVYDIFSGERGKRHLQPLACGLMAVVTIFGFMPYGYTGTGFGGMFVNTEMTILMKNILNVAVLFTFLQAGKWLDSEEQRIRKGEFYVITLSTLLGMFVMISAGNFMLLYIGIELASLPMACLVAYNKYRDKSAEAGAKYILMAALSSGIMLFGISFLYGATGTLYFMDMSAAISGTPMIIMGFVCFFAGLAFKISLVPFHYWTADVYEGAPSSVTAYLSVASKAAAVFALMFTLWHVFGAIENIWHWIMWAMVAVTITVGNLFALRQKDIKRFFAFSSVSQAGYIMLGLMSHNQLGFTATVFYVLVYLFSNFAAFGVISAIENASGKTGIADYNGLYKTNPALTWIMTLAVFSLGGIPPLAGFFSKFFIFTAAASQGLYILLFIALINTVPSLYYYLLIVRAMFINAPAEEGAVKRVKVGGYNWVSLALCVVGLLVAGVVSCIYGYVEWAGVASM